MTTDAELTFPKGSTELSRDPTPILEALYDLPEHRGWLVNANCSRIEAYDETGDGAYVPWLAIIDYFGKVIARVPARMVAIRYTNERLM